MDVVKVVFLAACGSPGVRSFLRIGHYGKLVREEKHLKLAEEGNLGHFSELPVHCRACPGLATALGCGLHRQTSRPSFEKIHIVADASWRVEEYNIYN